LKLKTIDIASSGQYLPCFRVILFRSRNVSLHIGAFTTRYF